MTVLIDGKLEDPLIKDKKVSLLGGVICGQKISMGSDIGPPPSPHSIIDQDFSPITTHSQDWMDVNNGLFEVRQYAKPCAFCTRNHLVCCEATRSGSKKCEACRVVKGVCVLDETPVFSEGRKVWCNPTTKSYGFEHPIQEVPTDDFDSGVRSVLKKVGVPTGGIPILSKGWVNHKGVERDQVGSSERSARSNLRRAKEAKANQPAKRQRRNPSKSVTKTRPDLDTVANGSSSKEDGDDEGNDEDEGVDKRGNTAETVCTLSLTTEGIMENPAMHTGMKVKDSMHTGMKDQVVELVIKAAIEALANCKVYQAEGRARRIKRVFKENVLGKSLVAGSKLKFERAQLEQRRQNSSTDDNSLPLNNSRPAPSTDPVVVESQSRGDLKVDHKPLLVDKSLTRKLSRVEGVHWRGLFDYVDPVEMNSGFRLMAVIGIREGHSRAETGMGPGIIERVVNLYLDDAMKVAKRASQMEGSAKLNSKSWWTEFEKYRPPLDDTAPPSPRESSIPTTGKNPVNRSTSLLRAPPTKSLKASTPRAVDPINRGVTPGFDDLVPWIPEGSEMESDGFTWDRRTAMGLLVETHYLLGQGIQELIRGNPGRRFMGLAAVSDQMELAMTRVIREMGGWFEHLESNGFVSYEAWDGAAGEGPAEKKSCNGNLEIAKDQYS
ncbi:hypothetical protein BY996DRAFT_6604814 [Phakopsora pachyrhizi]|nr:hypothetical protein BY996DRAFT_6604814 [Phakopsora pachyrhizi]